jgi:hypothetical protein
MKFTSNTKLKSAGAPRIREEEEFRSWLQREHKIRGRSVNDICSRSNRVLKLAALKPGMNEMEVVATLRRSEAYVKCSETVRSQLKRAAILYLTFSSRRFGR